MTKTVHQGDFMQNKQPFAVQDLYLHSKVMEADGTRTGDVVARTVRSVDRESNKYISCIWQFSADGAQGKQLTHGPGLDNSPQWSPDGKRLAFLSSRSGSTQVHLIERDGGEARQAGNFASGVSDLRWTPDGKSLLVTAAVPTDPDLRGGRPSGPVPQRDPEAPEIAWRLPYKADGVGYMLKREIRLFCLDARSGECVQLTDGPFDVMGFDMSPNGKHIAYVRTREGRFAHRTDLWVCDADGTRHRRLSQDHAVVMNPLWSPDGRWIAFSGSVKEGDALAGVWLADFSSGAIRPLGGDAVEAASGEPLHWSQDGKSLLLVRAWRGRHQLVSLGVPDGEVTVLAGGDRQLAAFACSAGHLFYCVEHPSLPSELWCAKLDGQHEKKLSDFNPWWKERADIEAQIRSFQVPDGKGGTETIEGWLIRATDAKKPTPLLNDVHGGPAAYALMDFDSNVFWQVLCSQGWSVLALNAVGSGSYGREFCERLAGHWGEYDFPQHLEAIEQLQRAGDCDERVAISGKSYGGYLSGWAIGQSTMFRAAVVMAPVGNIETHYGTSDGGYYADPFYMGTAPRFDRRLARKLSPLQYVERAKTPTLFMQGKDDERCPKCQSEELFVSLMHAGETAAELVLYPGEDHSFLSEGKPKCREDAATRIVEWIHEHSAQAVEEIIETETEDEGAAG
jgi:dipeptidyl aminopeptidase/acylaminoacyl peptidase